jgi:hypothetical protein
MLSIILGRKRLKIVELAKSVRMDGFEWLLGGKNGVSYK